MIIMGTILLCFFDFNRKDSNALLLSIFVVGFG